MANKKKTKNSYRGGARPNSGRKRLPDGMKKRLIPIYATASDITLCGGDEIAAQIGLNAIQQEAQKNKSSQAEEPVADN